MTFHSLRTFLSVILLAVFASPLSAEEAKDTVSENEFIEQLRRENELLKEQNLLLREKIELSDDAREESKSTQSNEKDSGGRDVLSPGTSDHAGEAWVSEESLVEDGQGHLEHGGLLTRQEAFILLESFGFDYRDLALGFMYLETVLCLSIADGNAHIAVWPEKVRRRPEIYSKVMEASYVWEYSLMSAKGKSVQIMIDKWEEAETNTEIREAVNLLGGPEIPREYEYRFNGIIIDYIESPNSLARCSETLPSTTSQARRRYKELRTVAKRMLEGDKNAFRRVDSVLNDLSVQLENESRKVGLEFR